MSDVKTTLVTNKVENLPVLDEVPEGATLIAEVDGEFYRVKGEGVGGGLVKTAIIKGDTYDATMEYFRKMQIDPSTAGDNPIKPTPADSFTCTNMSFEEANDFLLNGGVLNVVVLTMGKCVPGTWVCLEPSGERKITGGISFENMFFSFTWTPDSIKVTSG